MVRQSSKLPSKVSPIVHQSRSRQKVVQARTERNPVSSSEDFNLEEGDNGPDDPDDTNTPGPSNLDLEPSLKNTRSGGSCAPDIAYFFREFDFPDAKKAGAKVMRACKECIKIYGANREEHKCGTPNFFYQKNTGNTNLWGHLTTYHEEDYRTANEKNGWGYTIGRADTSASKDTSKDTQGCKDILSYSPSNFLKYLVRFIVADDQSIRVIECPKFRDLCMVLHGDLTTADIPHRDKMREAIVGQWHASFEDLKCELARSCRRISFTTDTWSSSNLASYLAVTSHWISCDESNRRLSMKAALISFHRITTRHTGVNIAKTILEVLDRAKVTLKIGHFTLDNAENNAVAMRELGAMLKEQNKMTGVDIAKFDAEKNRVRCYAHIINICSSHIASSLSSTPNLVSDSSTHDFEDSDGWDEAVPDSEYGFDELRLDSDEDDTPGFENKNRARGDALKRARKLVCFLQSSDERKLGFRNFIKRGNEVGLFNRVVGREMQTVKVPVVEPVRDVKTRWDSAYLMVLRLRLLQPAINPYIDSLRLLSTSCLKLLQRDWDTLEGLQEVLDIPYQFQHTMSTDATPVLLRAIIYFEKFMTKWEKLGEQHRMLKPWTDIGVKWATKYYDRMDETNAYVITMFLNPSVRLSWIESQWETKFIKLSKTWILDVMHQYRDQKNRELSPQYLIPPSNALQPLVEWLQCGSKLSMIVNLNRNTQYRPQWKPNTRGIAQANKNEFPTLFDIAMDYLTIQATSIPCECVFLSAKETDTAKRNKITPELMEILQLHKFSIKKERLRFTARWSREELEAEMYARLVPSVPTHDILHSLPADTEVAVDVVLLNEFVDD